MDQQTNRPTDQHTNRPTDQRTQPALAHLKKRCWKKPVDWAFELHGWTQRLQGLKRKKPARLDQELAGKNLVTKRTYSMILTRWVSSNFAFNLIAPDQILKDDTFSNISDTNKTILCHFSHSITIITFISHQARKLIYDDVSFSNTSPLYLSLTLNSLPFSDTTSHLTRKRRAINP